MRGGGAQKRAQETLKQKNYGNMMIIYEIRKKKDIYLFFSSPPHTCVWAKFVPYDDGERNESKKFEQKMIEYAESSVYI